MTKCNTPGDINEHLPVLERYASECSTVAELGVSKICSTWALLHGLARSEASSKKLYCVDIEKIFMGFVIEQANLVGINLQFIHENSATVNFDTEVDMLFIDTWHVYGHLKRELEHHHSNVKKYIILHDTENDAVFGETIRFWADFYNENGSRGLKSFIQRECEKSGYTPCEVSKGLQPAITEFLDRHSEWVVHEVYTNNNGLTVLKRK